jgi:hypothetical protein
VIRCLAGCSLALVLAACTSQSGGTLPEADVYVLVGQQFPLGVGQTAAVFASQAIDLVRFNGVLQDSRCPVDVTCVTAGSAAVLLTVQTALNVHDVSLEVPPEGTAEVIVDELTVTVVRLLPSAQQGVTIDPLDYVVWLVATESGSIPIPN